MMYVFCHIKKVLLTRMQVQYDLHLLSLGEEEMKVLGRQNRESSNR
ncbi:hypothetical protein ES288_D10G133100v1 [Gossypium darwinii]|uniref:Uncharacterized protein n=1 Tax=Gossypium darwinii TaxID=34276 RepID=A0A5D2AZB6_GOSDA|nr:hypothetical protein ES288_D10G133100v1 [Gossypium darwinii]